MRTFRMKNNSTVITILGLSLSLFSCYPDENIDVDVKQTEVNLSSETDLYIDENFTKKYGMAIRYRFVDRFVQPTQRVTPPRLETVRPMLDFIQKFWIDPYLAIPGGEEFFKEHVPSEVVLLGGLIFNGDGTVTLGTADAGAQITFTNVNAVDPVDVDWRDLQLQTVYHEFAHIIHQRYKLPGSFEKISPLGYTSAGSWFTLDDNDALMRGFTSPYGTSSPNEDFAEIVAFFLFDPDFEETFMTDEGECDNPECESRNEGRERIRQKLTAISQHYKKVVNVDLNEVRNAIQNELKDVQ